MQHARRTMNTLPLAQKLKLVELVQGTYAALKLPDREFAVYASNTLGVPITHGNISGIRHSLGIPATRTTTAATRRAERSKCVDDGTDTRLLILERLDAIEAKIDQLLKHY